mgnify:CR=1 FL=1
MLKILRVKKFDVKNFAREPFQPNLSKFFEKK